MSLKIFVFTLISLQLELVILSNNPSITFQPDNIFQTVTKSSNNNYHKDKFLLDSQIYGTKLIFLSSIVEPWETIKSITNLIHITVMDISLTQPLKYSKFIPLSIPFSYIGCFINAKILDVEDNKFYINYGKLN